MDLELLPKKQVASKTYKHYIVSSDPIKETLVAGKTEFFYVGKNSRKFDFLIKNFESGYAAENVEKAISILRRISEKYKLPDIIIVDAEVGELSLRELYRYISASVNYSTIPFVLDASGITAIDLKLYKSFRFFDEFFSLTKWKWMVRRWFIKLIF